nr:ATPase F0 subunit 8 [Abarenicola claparedi oceanica]
MPHLAPMSWILAPIMFMFILALLFSTTWWQYTPKFPQLNKLTTSNKASAFSSWTWN